MTCDISVTGHRLGSRLGGYGKDVYSKLLNVSTNYLLSGYKPNKVITGMALGFDQSIADACIILGIPFVAAIPFMGQEEKWPKESKDKYYKLLSYADDIVYVSGGYSGSVMQKRNEWMVDNSDMVS